MNDRFGEIAIGAELISRAQLEEALAIQRFCTSHVPMGRLLYDLGYICLADVREVLAKQRALRNTAGFTESGNLIGTCPDRSIQE